MIGLDPSHPSCIYTKMQFVSSKAKQYGVTIVLESLNMYPFSNSWPRSETYVMNAVRYMLTGNAISIEDRRHMLIYAALNTILVAKAYHIPLTTNDTDEPKWDTACFYWSRDRRRWDTICRPTAGHSWFNIRKTGAKKLYDKAMQPTFPAQQMF